MELADILSELWRRRIWLVLGVVLATAAAASTIYQVQWGIPPKFHSKSFEVGAGSVDILIDSPKSPIPDTSKQFDALQLRAGVYAQLLRTAPIREDMGKRMGIPWQAITAEGPTPVSAGGQRGARTDATPRASQLIAESLMYRLFTNPQANIPIVNIQTQAPTAREAIRLADVAVESLQAYIDKLQRDQKVPTERQVQIRRLSDAAGGTVTSDAGKKAGVLAFIAVMFGWCVLVVLASNVATSIRRARVIGQLQQTDTDADRAWEAAAAGTTSESANGHATTENGSSGQASTVADR